MKLFIPIIFRIFLILTILIGCVPSEEIKETDPVACNNRGLTYIMEGQYEKAIAYLSHAIRLNPEYAVPYNNRGFAYTQKGQIDKAISDYTKAIEIDPKYADPYNNRGFACCLKGQYDKTIADCTKAIELNPKLMDAYNNRGYAYTQKGQIDKAISDYTKAIEIDPMWAGQYYYNRGMAYYSQKKYEEAWDDVNKAQILNYEVDLGFLESLRIASGRQTDIESTRVNENKWEKECETYEECFFWCNTILSVVGKNGMNMLTLVEDKKLCVCEARN